MNASSLAQAKLSLSLLLAVWDFVHGLCACKAANEARRNDCGNLAGPVLRRHDCSGGELKVFHDGFVQLQPSQW